MSGVRHRRKGDRVEREIVARHKQLGVHAERYPLSGAGQFRGSGHDLDGKADIERPKATFRPVGGGAARFGEPRAGLWLAVGEGIETTLSVAVACSIPAWAALSAGGIRGLVLPLEATHVILCTDHDAGGTGQRAARDAAARWLAEGRSVRVAIPPEQNSDFNDVLTGRVAAKINEARHVE